MKIRNSFLIWCLVGILAFNLVGCGSQVPIKIGFAAQLTGRQSELGVASRNGAELAMEIINKKGGINGRKLELVVRDDKGDPDTARQVDAELVQEGVVALIGHPTSAMTAAVLPQMNEAKVVLLSNTSTSSQFTGVDDYFFRIIPSNDLIGRSLARYMMSQDIQSLTGVYDLNNQAFTETFWVAVRDEFKRLGGDSAHEFTFKSGEVDLKALGEQVAAESTDAVIFLASGVDVALLSQYTRQVNTRIRLFSSSWGQTQELLEKGGQAVEGLEIGSIFNPEHPSDAYNQFSKAYTERYGMPPTLGASQGYESVLALAYALEKTDGLADGLPEALRTITNLPGLQGNISIDQFGDVLREIYIVRVQDGQFKVVETINPSE